MAPSISILGVPMDLGQSRRGVDMGPAALRYAGLDSRLRRLGWTVHDRGNVEIPIRDTLPPEGGFAFLPAVVAACEAIYRRGVELLEAGEVPLYLGGDHSIAAGTIAAAATAGPTGVLWIDAHADFNVPETSPSGNLHGMPLAAVTGHGHPELVGIGSSVPAVPAENVVLIAVRDLDLGERVLLKESGATVYTMREVDERGIGKVAHEALDRLGHLPRLHVSLDMDALDPQEAPGVGTPVRGGLSYREAHLLMEILAERRRIDSLDVVEINPILDHRNHTAELAIELLTSLLGKTIL